MGTGVYGFRLTTKRGKLIVEQLGRTARGTRYLKNSVTLEAAKTSDPNFKSQLAQAMKELDPSQLVLPS